MKTKPTHYLLLPLLQVNYYERSLELMRQSMEVERKDISQAFKVKTKQSVLFLHLKVKVTPEYTVNCKVTFHRIRHIMGSDVYYACFHRTRGKKKQTF